MRSRMPFTHLSPPPILCRLRIGLDVGVRSRLPADSKSSSALFNADASTGSECLLISGFARSVGGVFDSGGDRSEGVFGSMVTLSALIRA